MASTVPNVSMSASSAAGPGTTIDFLTAKKTVTAVITTSALLTAGVVTIEASHDGTLWVALQTCGMEDMAGMAYSLAGVAFRFWRANLAVAAQGGTVRVTFMEAD